MNLDVLVKTAGVLGFIIGVITFVITRIERRKKVEIELFSASVINFSDDESLKDESLIRVRFTNIGQKAVIIKPRTLKIKYRKNEYLLSVNDFWGMDDFVELMPPTSTREIGVYLDDVLEKLEIVEPENYTEEEKYLKYKLKVSVEDHSGKRYKTNAYKYWEYVGDIVKK